MKAYQYTKLGLENLRLVELPQPEPGPREVVVRFHAVSLNYRDLLFAWGLYNPHPRLPAIPGSDGAGEVIEVGPGVTKWKVGDRVCPAFSQGWTHGPFTSEATANALGAGNLDGVFREAGAFHEDGLVRIPDRLSYEEASTLPCAGLTAWNGLIESGWLRAGETVLTLGTGGVSIFAIQIARMQGARIIVTSSSDEKLARAREFGAHETINYRTTPEWDAEVLRLTSGRGADHVVELGGAGTFPRSLNALAPGGHIAVIGLLTQGEGIQPLSILWKAARLTGIVTGSRLMFERFANAIAVNGLKPEIDRVFDFKKLPEALKDLESGSHFGKIVVRVN